MTRGPVRLFFCALFLASLASADTVDLSVSQIAPGVFVHFGVHEELSEKNLGAVANFGFIIGERCVAVIDSGGSLAVGRGLRAAIRKETPLPVCYVINTHVHPDHIFGNAAFLDDRPTFIGHARLATAMGVRGPLYQRTLEREIGSAAKGSEIIPPTQGVTERQYIDLGNRILELRAWKTAHTDNDLTVFDAATQTLWLSDLLFVGRIPVVDGSLVGWLDVGMTLKDIKASNVVPGHGPVDIRWPSSLGPQIRYLETLAADIRAAIAAGKTIGQALDSVAVAERRHWALFDEYNRRNAAAAFAELEWE